MNFLWGLFVGVGLVVIFCLLIFKNRQTENTKIVYESDGEVKKQENLVKIEDFISDKDKFTNNDLEKFLGVSDTTIGRYLQDLEEQGKIKQVGKTGKSVFYEKKL